MSVIARAMTVANAAPRSPIRGKPAHADLIAGTITDSLAQSARDHLVPVIHEVLLVGNEEQAAQRSAADSPINRGTEAARAAARMIQLFKTLKPHSD